METAEYFIKARELGNSLLRSDENAVRMSCEGDSMAAKAFDDLLDQVIDIVRFTVYGEDDPTFSCSSCRGCACNNQSLEEGS